MSDPLITPETGTPPRHEGSQPRRPRRWLWIAIAVTAVILLVLVLLVRRCSNTASTQPEASGSNGANALTVREQAFKAEIGLLPDTYYIFSVDNDTAFVIFDSIKDNVIIGRCHLLHPGSDVAPQLPLRCEIERRQLLIEIDTLSMVVKVNNEELHKLTDGDVHDDVCIDGENHTCHVTAYQEPPFTEVTDGRFVGDSLYEPHITRDLVYAHKSGYWTSVTGYDDDSYLKLLTQQLRATHNTQNLSLTMDIYEPVGDTLQTNDTLLSHIGLRPLIVFIHGGAFFVGDKTDSHICTWCKNFARMGYVTASVNYRMGFRPTKRDMERAGFDAVTDAQSALRYLLTQAARYHIDTTRIFLAGTSAGSITALMTAFAPTGTACHIVAVANMWGAVKSPKVLSNSHTDIISFHGTADQLVPYDEGIPFQDINKLAGKMLFNRLYGSASIDRMAHRLGYRSELHPFRNAPHAPIKDPDNHQLNQQRMDYIQTHITRFFYTEMIPTPVHIQPDATNARHFSLQGTTVDYGRWQVDNAFVLQSDDTNLWVVWKDNQGARRIRCSGRYANGIGFRCDTTLRNAATQS